MILITKTYSEITPESAENGEHSDCGMEWENVECTFRELVGYMREHNQPSCSTTRGAVYEWFSTGYIVDDYSTGAERETSIHYSRENPAHKAKYWRMAAQCAGLIKALE